MTIIDLLEADGFPPRYVASTHGGEYHGPCPLCGGDDRLCAWPNRGKEGGSYWCRQCNAGGDIIEYLKTVRKMSFPEACQFVGRELPSRSPSRSKKKGKKPSTPTQNCTAQAKQRGTTVVDPALWQKKAAELVQGAVYNLWNYQKDLWLKWLIDKRGLSEETIQAASLGAMPLRRFEEAESWGLAPEFKPSGDKKMLWLPAAHIVSLLEQEKVLRIKFRQLDGSEGPRYLFLRGSRPAPRVINPQAPFFAIVENDLDGLLLAQEAADLGLGVIALGSTSIKPGSLSPEVQDALKDSSVILVCLDFDRAEGPEDKGAWAGGKGGQAWLKKFPQAHRWPVSTGKDVTEMWQAGRNLKVWIEIGIERTSKPKG